MRLFTCDVCGQLLYFENTRCERCLHRLGYLPDVGQLSALEQADGAGPRPDPQAAAGGAAPEDMGPSGAPPAQDGGAWTALARPGQSYRFCTNAAFDACNWLVPADSPEAYCRACRHNRTVPDLSQEDNLLRWRKLEQAKHRLFYTLTRLGLPLDTWWERPDGLGFDFLADAPDPDGPMVMTGHDNGLITIAVKEADDAERERTRLAMGEPYRTLLGHFRHEVGHYFWDRLVRDGGRLEACRAVFGDDTQDYGEALRRHYAQGAPADWRERFVTAYASAHPWEDFAETWAHYLHIIDTMEAASAFGLSVRPKLDRSGELHAEIDFDPYQEPDFGRIFEHWLPLAFAVNSLNRSMGQPDLYPFVLAPPAVTKLAFVHDLIHSCRGAGQEGGGG